MGTLFPLSLKLIFSAYFCRYSQLTSSQRLLGRCTLDYISSLLMLFRFKLYTGALACACTVGTADLSQLAG